MSETKAVNENNFEMEVVKSEIPVLIDFWTTTCIPCRSLSVILDKFSHSVEGKLKMVKVNAEEQPGLAARLGVRGVPTLMLFYHGEVIGSRGGFLLPHELRHWIESALGNTKPQKDV